MTCPQAGVQLRLTCQWSSSRPTCQAHRITFCPYRRGAPRHRNTRCRAENQAGPGRQYETEFFKNFFGAPPPRKQDGDGGGKEPPSSGQQVDEEEEPDEEQLLEAQRQARQQALFNFVTLCLLSGSLAGLSTWEPCFRYLGRIWQVVRVGNNVQAYTELASEGFAWALLLTMGWPWNLLIYPVHLTRKELTSARQEHRGPSLHNIKNSVYNPFARRKRPTPQNTH
ncbi:hypothetical protein ABBQ38_002989 [Trebouxia sp. C0009 RCD-2024]